MKKFIESLIILCLIMLFCSCKKEEKIHIVDNLNFEINSKVKYSDLVKKSEEITLFEPDGEIDTSSLGNKKIIIKYLLDDELKYKSVTINIVDTIAPTIKYKSKLSTTKGVKIDLLKDVKVSDNSKETIKATVTGKYDINKVGDYNLKYNAIDSSGNSVSNDFILTVKNVSIKTSGYYMYKEKKYWVGINFTKKKKVSLVYNFCPGSACGGYQESGTYSVKNNIVTLKLTSYSDEMGEGKRNSTMKCTIKNEKNIVCNKLSLKWSSSFK